MKIYNPTGFSSNLTGSFSGSMKGTLVATGNIIPSQNIAFDLGTSTQRFRDIYLSSASIYLGNTTISEDNVVTTASLQSVLPTGVISSSNQLAGQTIDGDLTITGTVTAQEFHTEFISASIIYQSGSTKFGNSADDTHIFTGNVGIGTTTLSTTLTVGHGAHGIGSAYLGASTLPSIAGLFTDNGTNGGTGYGDLLIKARSDYGGIYDLKFYTAAANNTPLERTRIASSGLVYLYGQGVSAGGTLNLESEDPFIRFYDNGAGSTTDKKKWDIRAIGASTYEGLEIRTVNDANNSFSTKLWIKHDGNIGIGTTTPAQKLHVDGAIRLTSNPTVTGDGSSAQFWNQAGVGPTIAGNAFQVQINGTTPALHILNTGYVGIGTTSPTVKLDVVGGINTTDVIRVIKDPSDTIQQGPSVYLVGGTGSSYTQLQQGVGRFIIFGFNGAAWGEKMTIRHSDGNVGIGTTSPVAKLHVDGGIWKGRNSIGNLASTNLSILAPGENEYTFACQLDNTWRTLINNIDNYSFIIEIAGGDAGTKTYVKYYVTASNVPYGVISIAQIHSVSGGWNTGTIELQTSSAGGSFILQVKATSYYSSSNVGGFVMKIHTF